MSPPLPLPWYSFNPEAIPLPWYDSLNFFRGIEEEGEGTSGPSPSDSGVGENRSESDIDTIGYHVETQSVSGGEYPDPPVLLPQVPLPATGTSRAQPQKERRGKANEKTLKKSNGTDLAAAAQLRENNKALKRKWPEPKRIKMKKFARKRGIISSAVESSVSLLYYLLFKGFLLILQYKSNIN